MIFPDDPNAVKTCPICYFKLSSTNNNGIIKYYCPKAIEVNNENFYHYEFYRYKDKSVFFQYVIPPVQIYSEEGSTTINYLKPTGDYESYYYIESDVSNRKGSLYLTHDNKEKIFKKIKLFSVFS